MTPEEKLFAVIQRGGKGAPLVASSRFTLSPAQLLKRIQELLAHPRLNLVALNRALYVGIGVLVLINVLMPLLWRPSVEQVKAAAVQQVEVETFTPPLEGLQSSEAYAQTFQTHNPFHVLAPPPIAVATPQGPDYADLLKQDFRLVGIAWGANPQAMIEQVGQQRTYTVKAGDALPPFMVKAIQEDHVVLTVESKELELF